MSYIRSTSNTEHVYIFESSAGIELLKGPEEHFVIPRSIFVNLIRKHILDNGCTEDYKYRGGSLRFYVEDGTCLWHLKYKNIDFSFSGAILEYLINGCPWDFCTKKEYSEYHRSHLFKHSPWNKKKGTK